MPRTRASLAIVASATILAACGGGRTHLQSYTPSPTNSTGLPSASAPTSSTALSSPAPSRLPSIPVPTVTPPAQDAVNSYMGLNAAASAASLDPATADLTALNAHLTGAALALYDTSFANMRTAGLAYRGTPADPRVTVQTIVSPKLIFLTSCPLVASSDPFVQYTVATGKPVPVAARTPPPPYKMTLTMVLRSGSWRLSAVLQDTSKTCTA